MRGRVWKRLMDMGAGPRRALAWAVCTAATAWLAVPAIAAPPDSPLVTMLVTLPSGEVRTLSAHDSETVTFVLADGTLVGVRPTIRDSKPWSRTTVTFFTMPSGSKSAEEIGAIDVKTGGPSEALKAGGFKVAVSTVALDPVDPVSRARATALTSPQS